MNLGCNQAGVPKTAPCLSPQAVEDANITGIISGKWYITKLYSDILAKKPEVAAICLFTEFGSAEELLLGIINQGVMKNVSGSVTSKGSGDFSVTITVPANPPTPLALKISVVDQDSENLSLYACGGQQGFFIHLGLVLSRQKNIDSAYISKVDPTFKSLNFQLEGMAVTNQNCPPN